MYIHYITTLFVLESFILSCWLVKGKKIGIGIGQFAWKKIGIGIGHEKSWSVHHYNKHTNTTMYSLSVLFKPSLVFS